MESKKPLSLAWGLRLQLVSAIVAATAVLLLAVALLEDPLLQYRQEKHLEQRLQSAAQQLTSALARGVKEGEALSVIGQDFGMSMHVLNAYEQPLPPTPDYAWADSVLAGQSQHFRAWVPFGSFGASRYLFRLSADRIALIYQSHAVLRDARSSQRELLAIAGILALAIAALLSLILSRTLIDPIRRLTQAAHTYAGGQLSLRLEESRPDELGLLARAMNHMADRLAHQLRTLTHEEARLRTILQSMSDAVLVTDVSRRIVMHNESLEQLFGQSLVGQRLHEVFVNPVFLDAIKRVQGGATAQRVDVHVTSECLGPRDLEAHIAPLPNQQGIVTILHDTTHLRRAEAIRRDFVANASHELRTPLTAIRGFTETLQDSAGEDPESRQRFLAIILRHTERLQRLVDDLLALSRAESEGELTCESIVLEPILRDIVSGLASQAESKKIHIDVSDMDSLPCVFAEQRALEEVFINLIENAVKYNSEGGQVKLVGRAHESMVEVVICDTGPGIAANDQQRIFERFYRVDAGRSRSIGGTGLGLAIVKHRIQQLRGTIHVDSTPGQGTTFRVLLPKVPSSPSVL